MRNVMEIAKQLATRDTTSGEPEHNTYVGYVIWENEDYHMAAACGSWKASFLPREGETIRVILDNPVITEIGVTDKTVVFGKVSKISYEVNGDNTYIHINAIKF